MYGVLSIIPDEAEKTVLGKDTTIDEYVHEQAWEQVSEWTKALAGKVLPGIAKSPALKPVVETKKDIEETTSEVRNLPQEQKKAICKEVCGP